MKILFYRYNSICEPSFIKFFKSQGITVVEESTEIYNKNTPGTKLVSNVSKILSNDSFIFVMSINFFPALSAVCNIFKIPYISIIVDCPVWELYSKEVANPVNRIFVFDSVQYSRIKDANPEHIFHMPLCTDSIGFENVITNASQSEKKRFACDISFIGSLYTEKCAYNKPNHFPPYVKGYLDAIIKTSTGLFGTNFIYDVLDNEIVSKILEEEILYTFPEDYSIDYKALIADELIGIKVSEQERIMVLKQLSEIYGYNIDVYTGSNTLCLPKVNNRGFAKSLTEMPLIFNQSKINLNITSKTIQKGIPQRVFDVLACHGFLISNYQEELYEYLTPGKDLEIFSSIEELNDKISYYLSHENERTAIAQHGYNTILKYHTVNARVNEILAII